MAEPSSNPAPAPPPENDFSRQAQQPQVGLFAEFLEFVVQSASYWIIPVVLALGLLGTLVWLTSTGAAPFIYSLF